MFPIRRSSQRIPVKGHHLPVMAIFHQGIHTSCRGVPMEYNQLRR